MESNFDNLLTRIERIITILALSISLYISLQAKKEVSSSSEFVNERINNVLSLPVIQDSFE